MLNLLLKDGRADPNRGLETLDSYLSRTNDPLKIMKVLLKEPRSKAYYLDWRQFAPLANLTLSSRRIQIIIILGIMDSHLSGDQDYFEGWGPFLNFGNPFGDPLKGALQVKASDTTLCLLRQLSDCLPALKTIFNLIDEIRHGHGKAREAEAICEYICKYVARLNEFPHVVSFMERLSRLSTAIVAFRQLQLQDLILTPTSKLLVA